MKKILTFVLAVLFLLALFSGCGQKPSTTPGGDATAAPATAAPATKAPENDAPGSTPEPEGEAEPEPTEEGIFYHYAKGNVEVDEHGYTKELYEYTMPLTNSDEEFTYWGVVWSPQLLPEDGYNATPLPKAEREATGVHVEYVIIPSESRQQNYAVLLAADDLCDMMTGSLSMHPTTIEEAIEDGYYVNLWDYRDYCPDYIYWVTFDRQKDTNTYATVFRSPDLIGCFYTMQNATGKGTNYLARGDWLEKLGLTNDDIVTYEDLHDMLMGFKVNIDTCDFPWSMNSTIDIKDYATFTAYDTIPSVSPTALGPMYVIDGKVYFSHVTERDKAFMTRLNSWYNDGLVDPNWASYASTSDIKDRAVNSRVGYMVMNISEVTDYEMGTPDPNCRWDPILRPVLRKGQTFHLGGQTSKLGYGTVSVSAKCANIPLAVTWCDWRYSLSGSDLISWGPEGVLWEYDDQGKRVATEFALSEPQGVGFGWLVLFYGFNALSEHGIGDGNRSYLVPGNERMREISQYWAQWDYDAAYEYPTGAKLDQEQNEEVERYKNDLVTYIAENYLAFVDGSKPLSEWDSYVNGLMQHGFEQVVALYQDAYDRYITTMA
ncbi:MAG: hypothetical protein IKG89_00075 [Oscillospiraceae bacterium]|nr:hypothetical protein [Oscillospiraceae bacterium]